MKLQKGCFEFPVQTMLPAPLIFPYKKKGPYLLCRFLPASFITTSQWTWWNSFFSPPPPLSRSRALPITHKSTNVPLPSPAPPLGSPSNKRKRWGWKKAKSKKPRKRICASGSPSLEERGAFCLCLEIWLFITKNNFILNWFKVILQPCACISYFGKNRYFT